LGGSLMLGGTIGYMIIEGWSLSEALFMTVITLSTVGYGEVRPLTNIGMVFSIILIFFGVGTVAYTFSTVADYIVAGELRGVLRRQRMIREIGKLRNHYIICGYGRVGKQVADGLQSDGYDIVVVEADPEQARPLEEDLVNHILGDAAEDRVLLEAGIEHARGLFTCLRDDADNVLVTLTARTLNPALFIIARSNATSTEQKLHIAGANQVINPYLIAGHRMATQMIHPGVMEFLDVVMRRKDLELHIEEIIVGEGSTLEGRALSESRVRSETGVNVLAIRRADDRLFTDVGPEFLLRRGDALICLGTPQQLASLADLAEDQGKWSHFVRGITHAP
jgi:voltage-gated potassium channel